MGNLETNFSTVSNNLPYLESYLDSPGIIYCALGNKYSILTIIFLFYFIIMSPQNWLSALIIFLPQQFSNANNLEETNIYPFVVHKPS